LAECYIKRGVKMLRHVVLLKFREAYSEAVLREIEAELDALPDQISQIISYKHGRDAAVVEGTFDFAITADFACKEDCLAYLGHPAHQAVGGKIMDLIADASQVQFYC
jgi:hypothetical protein